MKGIGDSAAWVQVHRMQVQLEKPDWPEKIPWAATKQDGLGQWISPADILCCLPIWIEKAISPSKELGTPTLAKYSFRKFQALCDLVGDNGKLPLQKLNTEGHHKAGPWYRKRC